jgi:transposase
MAQYVGLDVGLKVTAIAIVDDVGTVVWRGRETTHPEMLGRVLRQDGELSGVAIETGSLTPWLHARLTEMGFSVICVDARRAAEALRGRRVKTDRSDAWALAEMLRSGWYTAVHVKSLASHRWRALLRAREKLVQTRRDLSNQVRGLLRPFGIRIAATARSKRFAEEARMAVADDALLSHVVGALLEAIEALDSQLADLNATVREEARRSSICTRAMTVPGVGPTTALAFAAAIDDVRRFPRAREIGVYVGLTPRHYQSGEIDRSLGISRQGDELARHYLYEAANSLLVFTRQSTELKRWGLHLLREKGGRKARIAVARKLAIILTHLWRDGAYFDKTSA